MLIHFLAGSSRQLKIHLLMMFNMLKIWTSSTQNGKTSLEKLMTVVILCALKQKRELYTIIHS